MRIQSSSSPTLPSLIDHLSYTSPFRALDKFRAENKGQLPRPYNKEDGARFVEIAKELGASGDYKVTNQIHVHVACTMYMYMYM